MTVVQDQGFQIRTDRLRLRYLKRADVGDVARILNHPDVGRMIRQIELPYVVSDAAAWLASHAEERTSGAAFRFGAVLSGRLIGCADVDEIGEGRGELGFWFDPAFWGHGYAREAARAVMAFAFDTLALDRLHSSHAANNLASAKLLSNLGFTLREERTVWSNARRASVRQVFLHLPRDDWMKR